MADGPDKNQPNVSLSGLIATLAPTALVAGVYFIIFLILRKSQRRFYAPRTYLGTLREEYVYYSEYSLFTCTDTLQGTFCPSPSRMVQLDWSFLEDPRYLCSSAPISRCLPLPSIPPHDCGHYVRRCLYHNASVSTYPSRHTVTRPKIRTES